MSRRGAAACRRSELVADAQAHLVGRERDVLDSHEAGVFPLAAHEQAAPQAIFQAEAGGPAGHEAVGALVVRRQGVVAEKYMMVRCSGVTEDVGDRGVEIVVLVS